MQSLPLLVEVVWMLPLMETRIVSMRKSLFLVPYCKDLRMDENPRKSIGQKLRPLGFFYNTMA
jgi:hypothetical protein